MVKQDPIKPRIEHLYLVLLIFMSLLSALRFWRIITVTWSQTGATDFHSYWYYGHFLRQGRDPFAAFLESSEPSIPVFYIDGNVAVRNPIRQPGLTAVPSNTPLMLLLLAPFAFLSWASAKVIWMVLNLTIICLLPMLVIKLFRGGSDLPDKYKAFVCLAFWGMLATSNAGGNGQTSLIVFALMLIAVLAADKHWFLAGLALGVALSKYPLSLPFLVFLLFKRRYRLVATALGLQFLGFALLSLVTQTPVPILLGEYGNIAIGHLSSPGIQLLSPANGIVPYLVILLFISFVLGALSNRMRGWGNGADTKREIADMHLLTMLTLGTLLVVYHREYDAIVIILFIALAIIGLANHYWELGRKTTVLLASSVFMITLLMSRPGSWLGASLPKSLSLLGEISLDARIPAFALATCLFICLMLFFKIRAREEPFEEDLETQQTAVMKTMCRPELVEPASIEKIAQQEQLP